MTRAAVLALTALLIGGMLPSFAQGPNRDDPRVMQFVYTVWPQRGQLYHRLGMTNRIAVDPAEVDMTAPPGSDRTNLLEAIERFRPDLQYDNARMPTMDWWGKPDVSPTPLEWIEEQKQLGRTVHDMMRERGAGLTFTYVSAFRIFGNYEQREGFWAFYDNWEDYAPLHFGPKPQEDPWDWISIIDGERRQWRVNPDDYYGYLRYNVCVENPHWRQYMEAIARNVAEDGNDGVFVDNTMHRCECSYCQRAFEEHLRAEYTPEQLEEFFGTRDVTALRINSRDSIPLQIETQRVWQKSMAGLLAHLKRGGSAAHPNGDFLIVTNGTAYGLLPGYCSNITDWANAGMTAAFQERTGEQMGCPQHEVGEGLRTNELQDMITYYATVAGLDRPRVRANPQQDRYYLRARPESFTLAMFEALGFGGIFCDTGNLIGEYGIYPKTEALREELYSFYHARHDLYTDMTSGAEVGVMLALVDETLADNWGYELEAQAVRDLLLDQHIPFDLLPEGALTPEKLARYRLIIVPGVSCIGDEQAEVLRDWAQAGGALMATGDAGMRYQCGAPRETSCLTDAMNVPWLWRDGMDESIPFRHAADWYRGMALRGHNPLARLNGLWGREAFIEEMRSRLPNNPAAVTFGSDATGVRVSVTRPRDETDRRIVAHLVNYDVRWDADVILDKGSMDMPQTAHVQHKSLTLALRTPPGTIAQSIRLHSPDTATVDAQFEQLRDGVAVELPDLAIYAAVEVVLDDGVTAGERAVADLLGSLNMKDTPPLLVNDGEAARPIPDPLTDRVGGSAVSPWMALDQMLIVPRQAGETLRGTVEVSDRWEWGAKVWIFGPDGLVWRSGIGPGGSEAFEIRCEQAGLHVICGDAGLANWRVSVDDAPLLMPTSVHRPMQTCGMPTPMRFYVPEGVGSFSITTRAADPEMRVTVSAPGGDPVLDVELERREQVHEVAVPNGADGTVWTVLVSRGDRDLHRTMPLYFSEEIPGMVACAQ